MYAKDKDGDYGIVFTKHIMLWFHVDDFVVVLEEKKMWVVTFDDDSIVRIWTCESKLDEEVVELQRFRQNYYKRKFDIKSINEEGS